MKVALQKIQKNPDSVSIIQVKQKEQKFEMLATYKSCSLLTLTSTDVNFALALSILHLRSLKIYLFETLKTLWTWIGSDLLILTQENNNLFLLTVQIILVLLM